MASARVPIWRDDRFWKVTLQILAVVAVVAIADFFLFNLRWSIARRGSGFGFDFLGSAASFDIGEHLIPFKSSDPYGRAFGVGILNSLKIMLVGLVLTTLLGIAAGVARFSKNWLLRKIVVVYVELFRNTPILLQMLFWYFAVFSNLPKIESRILVLGTVYLSNRGVVIPWISQGWAVVGLGVLAIAALLIWRWRTRRLVEAGDSGRVGLYILVTFGVAAALILLFGLGWSLPVIGTNNQVTGGLSLSAEYCSALLALVFYTGAFVAEIVRGGILAVPKGQWEAAKALGFNNGLVMRLVVFPQALRVMVPPLTSEYLNLCKNSSLAVAIAYPEVYSVSSTIFNQTGRAVEMMLLIMATYLTIDLIISLVMNFINSMVQIKER